MESLELLRDLRKLPAAEGAAAPDGGDAMARIRSMDRGHFAIGVCEATDEALEPLFEAQGAPEGMAADLADAHLRAFPRVAEEGISVHDHYREVVSRGQQSAQGFVSNLKGKMAELRAEDMLEEQNPGYDFELAPSATQAGWDLVGTSQEGPEILVQVKFGAAAYAGDVVGAMGAQPNYPFAVSTEVYGSIAESHPELVERLTDLGPAAELTESVEEGLASLASSFGVDVPDSLGEALPYVGDVILGLRLIWSMASSERELAGVDLSSRARVHGIRTLALAARFGISQVCVMAGGAGGTALGSVVPGAGNVAGGIGGSLAGAGVGMGLNRLLQPRIEEIAIGLVGGDADDVFYLMNKVEIDRIGESLAATRLM